MERDEEVLSFHHVVRLGQAHYPISCLVCVHTHVNGRESSVNSYETTMSLIWYTCTRDTLLFLADGLCLLVGELPGQT